MTDAPSKQRRVTFEFDDRSCVSIDELKRIHGPDAFREVEVHNPKTGETKTLYIPTQEISHGNTNVG